MPDGFRVDNVDLGPNTIGTFGPAPGLPSEMLDKARSNIGSHEYSRTPSNRWICVDGRLTEAQWEDFGENEYGEADPAIPGGIVVSETGDVYMQEPDAHKPRSVVTAEVTLQAVADDVNVVIHGDNTKGKEGCKANSDLRGGLSFAAQNSDIVVPLAWTILGALDVQKHINQDEIARAIINGDQAAQNDSIWDVTASEVVDIAVANGAEYEELVGEHVEAFERADVTPNAFAKTEFAHHHSSDEHMVNVLSASLGAYAAECYRRAEINGENSRDAAMKIMRVTTLSVAMSKMLMHEDTDVVLISEG